MIISRRSNSSDSGNHEKPQSEEERNTLALHETIRELSQQIQEKDNEINILVSFIRKHNRASLPTEDSQGEIVKEVICKEQRSCPPKHDNAFNVGLLSKGGNCYELVRGPDNSRIDKKLVASVHSKAQAFEAFRRSYPGNQAIQDNKALLKEKYQEAKSISEHVNRARENINSLKLQIQKVRIERAMQGLHGGDTKDTIIQSTEEGQLISQIEAEKRSYKESFNKLRDLKREIEQLHHLLEQNHLKLQEDYQRWLALMGKVESTSEDFNSKHPNAASDKETSVIGTSCQARSGEKILYSQGQDCKDRPAYQREVSGHTIHRPTELNSVECAKASPRCKNECTVPVTGNAKADAEIAAFYKARDTILKLRAGQCGSS